jgi:hypothetical protein
MAKCRALHARGAGRSRCLVHVFIVAAQFGNGAASGACQRRFQSGRQPGRCSGFKRIEKIAVVPGNGSGAFTAPCYFGAGTFPDGLAAGDFKRDGKLDLAVANWAANSDSMMINVSK